MTIKRTASTLAITIESVSFEIVNGYIYRTLIQVYQQANQNHF